ncbi:MAG: Uma2 family endonuclease [Geodermatophilaceae bacterium]|nr:Uma2 family endonuclease [Geodermatophilaceae bacterium]
MVSKPPDVTVTQEQEWGTTPDAPDPYRYGWRYVSTRLPNGEESFEQVPLTLYDVLHPQEEDQVMHSDDHERFCTYLHYVLTAQLAGVAGAVVLHDVRVAWDVPELGAHGPDIAVYFNVRERRNWSTFDVAEEGTRPALIVEVASPETRRLDLNNKVDAYDEAGVLLYIIVDTSTRKGVTTRRLLGYHGGEGKGYVPLAPNKAGRLWLEPVRLWLGLEGNELVCYDEAGHPLDEYAALALARKAAEARAVEEAAGRAAEASARAKAEARAVEEAAARRAAEARLRELEDELRRLRGEG